MRDLGGKLVLVAGGSGGIGAASARLFAEAGATVAVTHRPGKPEAGAAVVAGLPGQGHLALAMDVADTASIVAAREALEAAGHATLDVLVNSAGFTKAVAHADLDGLDDALIDRMFAVNWRGQFATVRTFAPMLKASGDGLVVFISSIAALNGAGSSIAYAAVKAATETMTKSLARAVLACATHLTFSTGQTVIVDGGRAL